MGNEMPPWKWPSGVQRSDAIATLKEVILAYPKEGQDDVDKGGWKLVVDQLADKGYARIEYTSGIGNFAFFSQWRQALRRRRGGQCGERQRLRQECVPRWR